MEQSSKPVAVVTGASRGIGSATALALHASGWRVALAGLEPDRLAAQAAHLGPDAMAVGTEVTDAAAVQAAMDAVAERWGRIDAVVSNAGIGHFDLVRSMAPQQFRHMLQVNAEGTLNVMQAAFPHLVATRGYFLTIASLAAAAAPPGLGGYGASKAAIETLSDTLRAEVAHLGVAVGVAYFGWIDTELVRSADRNPAFGRVRAQLPGPMRRVDGPEAAARAILAGIRRRRSRVYAPRWLAWVLPLRWLLAADARRFRAAMPEIERLARDGAGGRGGDPDRPD